MTITRTPFYFGRQSDLFGWLHAPAGGARDLAMVLCAPVGHEYINSHRPMRHLADALARAGIPTLRFDYRGTGDSAGVDEEPGRVAAWRASIIEAIDEARALTGRDRIGLAGLRLGATLAASVAAEIEVACLVLWAPVRGREFSRELKALHLTGGNRDVASQAGAIEPGGFVYTAETQQELAALKLEALPKSPRILIAVRDDLAPDTRLLDAWAAAGAQVEQRALPGFTEMFLPPHNVVVPHQAIAQIVEFVARDTTAINDVIALPPLPRELHLGNMRETITQLPDGIFGIRSEPVAFSKNNAPLILLPNAGATHHAGPNRLYVLLARSLAKAGFRTLRFDLPGLGDTFVDDPSLENDPYLDTTSDVIAATMRTLWQEHETFAVMGLCSGAHAAFHAAVDIPDAPLVESILINPLTFYFKRGMSLDQAATTEEHRKWLWYLRAIRRPDRWRKLLRGDVEFGRFFRTLFDKMRSVVLRRKSTAPRADDLDRDLRTILDSGRAVTFVFSRFDPGYDLLMNGARSVVEHYRKQGRLALWQIDDANHTFESKSAREAMIASVVEHMRARTRRALPTDTT